MIKVICLLKTAINKIKILLQSKDYTITENGEYSINPDDGYDAISGGTITVNIENKPSATDISDEYVCLCNYSGTTVPDDLVGWDKLENSAMKIQYCPNLTTFNKEMPNLKTSNYTMFSSCPKLTRFETKLPMNYLNYVAHFLRLSSLQYIEIYAPNAITPTSNFTACTNLVEFKGSIGKVTDGTNLFYNLKKLKKVDIDLHSLTKGTGTFRNCTALTDWRGDISNCSAGASIFQGCSNLTNLDFYSGSEIQIGGFRPAYNPKLTYQSFQNIINHLKDMGAVGSYKNMYISSAQNNMLTDEDRANIVNKEWIINIV